MIGVIKNNNRFYPILLCDKCGKMIDDRTEATFIWNESCEFKLVCKGRCLIPNYKYSMDMIRVFNDLLSNYGLFVKRSKKDG